MLSILSVAAVALLPQGTPDQAPHAIDILPLNALHAPRPHIPPVPFGTLLEPIEYPVMLQEYEEGSQQFSTDSLIDFLNNVYSKEVAAEQLRLRPEGDNLVLAGEDQLLRSIRDDVAQWVAIATQPIEVTAALYEGTDDELPATVVNGEGLQRLVQGRRLLWSGAARTRSGDSCMLEKCRSSTYVRTINVVVAQKSTLSTPATSEFFEGIRLHVEVHALAASQDLVLLCQFGLGQRRGAPRSITAVAGQAAIDYPVLESDYGGCSARVVDGGAMVLGVGGATAAGSRVVLVIGARHLAPPAPSTVHGVSLLPISALTTPSLQTRSRPPSGVRGRDDAELATTSITEHSSFGRLDGDALQELLRGPIAAALEAEGAFLRAEGGYLILRADDTAITATEKTLRALQDRWLVNTDVRAVVDLNESDGTVLGGRGAAGPVLHNVAVPTLLGREAVLFRGLETTELHGLEAEIAQEAAITRPVVRTVQSGLWLRARTSPGSHGLWLSSLAQHLVHAEPARRPIESGGFLMLGASEQTHNAFEGEVAANKDVQLGDGPNVSIDGKNFGSSLRLRANRR